MILGVDAGGGWRRGVAVDRGIWEAEADKQTQCAGRPEEFCAVWLPAPQSRDKTAKCSSHAKADKNKHFQCWNKHLSDAHKGFKQDVGVQFMQAFENYGLNRNV